MLGLFRYRDILYYAQSKLLVVCILLVSFYTNISYAQNATVTIQTQTQDGTKHADYTLTLENQPLGLSYTEKTDATGKAVFSDITTPVEEENPMIPLGYKLDPGNPNPTANSLFKLRYQMPANDNTNIKITFYDITGQKVKELINAQVGPGYYETAWDGSNEQGTQAANGIYLYVLETPEGILTNKMVKLGNINPAQPYNTRLGNAQDTKTHKINSVDYTLSGIDSLTRFDPQTSSVTINGDTLMNRLLTEQFTNNAPSSLSWSTGDTLEILNRWYIFGTELDTIINQNTAWTVTTTTDSSTLITPTNPGETNNIPIELLARAIYGTTKNVTIPTTYIAGPGQTAAGEVKTPNGTPLSGINIAAYDTLNNFIKMTMSGAGGSYTLDSLYQETIDLIFTDPQNRTDPETTRVALPSWLEQILQETYNGYQGGNLQGREGERIGVAKADFPYNTGLDTLILVNTYTWQNDGSTPDSIYYKTNNPQANGNILIQLIAQATGGTQNQEDIIANLADMVTLSGKIVDNDLYFQGDGPPHPGILDYFGGRMVFTNGIYSIRIPAQDSIDILTTPTNSQGDTTGWTSTHRIPANTDQTGIILHPITNNTIEGLEALFGEFYSLVNDSPRHFNYFGKKYIKKTNPAENVYWIPRVTVYGDTITTADQDSVENYLLNNLIPGQQQPMGIYKATLQDTVDLFNNQGRIYIHVTPGGNAGGGTKDFDSDGQIDQGNVTLPKLGGNFYWPWAAEEIFTTETGPNELDDSRFDEYTVLQSSNAIPHTELQVFDKKLRRIGENFPPKEKKSRILGGAKFSQ